jgi:histidyl-tRNA synthetase
VAQSPAPVDGVPAEGAPRKREAFRAPKGTRDVLPPESDRWQALVAAFAGHVGRAGYGLVQSPMFEEMGVFSRVGEGTDVVRKEMYDFLDKGGRHLALRPEGTASIGRAFVEHHPATPWKVWYAAPSFRYERAQANRYRQHHQLGLEAIGTDDPDLDVEVIALLADFYRTLGLRQVDLVINSIGTPADRSGYIDRLRSFLVGRIGGLDPDDQEKVEGHPMRVLDTKRPASLAVVADAPLLLDHLSAEAEAHFTRVQDGLDALGVVFRIEPRLVRGLDYYTHTAFEFQSAALGGAQNTIGGGGRYDGLVESLGGAPTPGIGFGTGIERLLATCDAEGVFGAPAPSVDVFVIDTAGGTSARDVSFALRRQGVGVDRAFGGGSYKSQEKQARRSGATLLLTIRPEDVGEGVASLRPLQGEASPSVGAERIALDEVAPAVKSLLDRVAATRTDAAPTPNPVHPPASAPASEEPS